MTPAPLTDRKDPFLHVATLRECLLGALPHVLDPKVANHSATGPRLPMCGAMGADCVPA